MSGALKPVKKAQRLDAQDVAAAEILRLLNDEDGVSYEDAVAALATARALNRHGIKTNLGVAPGSQLA